MNSVYKKRVMELPDFIFGCEEAKSKGIITGTLHRNPVWGFFSAHFPKSRSLVFCPNLWPKSSLGQWNKKALPEGAVPRDTPCLGGQALGKQNDN